VFAVSPASLNVVPVIVAIWAKVGQATPWQRSTRYVVTLTLSVAAVQMRSIWLPPAAIAVSVPGAVGA